MWQNRCLCDNLHHMTVNKLRGHCFQLIHLNCLYTNCEERSLNFQIAIVSYISFFYYGESVVELTSAWLEILATIYCYRFITSSFKFINSKSFSNVLIVLLHIYAAFFYIYIFFCSKSLKYDSHKLLWPNLVHQVWGESSTMRTRAQETCGAFPVGYVRNSRNGRRKQKLFSRNH